LICKKSQELAEWYNTHLGIDPVGPVPWSTESGHTIFSPFAKNTDYFSRDSQQWMLNLRVTDLAVMIVQLEAAEIAVETREEWDGEYGKFARFHDPEGNPIELWEPPARK